MPVVPLLRLVHRRVFRRLALVGLFATLACGGGDSNQSDRSQPVPIRGGERLGWNQAEDSIAQLRSLTFKLYVDGQEATLSATRCDEAGGPSGFQCSGGLPPMPSGQHALELTSVLNGVESDRSSPLFVTVGGAAATTAISSLDMRAAPANSTTICAGNPQTDCYNVQVIASGLGAVTGLTPIPDGRVMFIEDGQQIRIVVRDSVRAVVALPFEVGRQLTGLTLDTKFETSGSVFVAWSELDSRVPGLNITRYRELGNVLAEGATIATALPSAVDVATPLAVDDEGLVYVAVPVNPDKPVPHFLSGGGVVMRFDRDGLVPRSNQHGSPIVAAGYPVPLVLTIDRPNRKVWLTGRDYGQLAAISAFGLQALSRGPWPHEPVVIEGLGKGEQIESVAISNQAATADAESELLIATAGRLRKVTLTQRATIASLSNIPVGDGFFVRNVATGGDGAAYVSATLRDGSTLVLRLTRLST